MTYNISPRMNHYPPFDSETGSSLDAGPSQAGIQDVIFPDHATLHPGYMLTASTQTILHESLPAF
ncbi:MAG TPA: hypothetical protein VIH66_03160 [Gammaproteobacteria bacterium]